MPEYAAASSKVRLLFSQIGISFIILPNTCRLTITKGNVRSPLFLFFQILLHSYVLTDQDSTILRDSISISI